MLLLSIFNVYSFHSGTRTATGIPLTQRNALPAQNIDRRKSIVPFRLWNDCQTSLSSVTFTSVCVESLAFFRVGKKPEKERVRQRLNCKFATNILH